MQEGAGSIAFLPAGALPDYLYVFGVACPVRADQSHLEWRVIDLEFLLALFMSVCKRRSVIIWYHKEKIKALCFFGNPWTCVLIVDILR